jgi:tRNA-dihydrouridine synthase
MDAALAAVAGERGKRYGPLPDIDRRVEEAWRFYREKLGSPRFACAPMVGQSELPYRMLLRQSGCDICWTPMLHADEFAAANKEEMIRQGFSTCDADRPLVVQFCANSPEDFLQAALQTQDRCDAVDLNLGCPQSKAIKGGWGGALMDEEHWHLVYSIVRHAVSSPLLRVPVTCKIRVFKDDRKTVRFAKMLEEAGCSLLTVHGRQRDRALHHAPANWSAILAVREALRIPVMANGGVSSLASAEECLQETGCVAAMVATALLADAELFVRYPEKLPQESSRELEAEPEEDQASSALKRSVKQCLRYLTLCEEHLPWSVRWPRDHLRALLATGCRDSAKGDGCVDADVLLALDAVGSDAGRSPPAVGAEDALKVYWQGICQEFRDVIRVFCVRRGLCDENQETLEDLPFFSTQAGREVSSTAPPKLRAAAGAADSSCLTSGGSKAADAIARKVPVSRRYVDRQQQRAAALRSCMAATSKWASRAEKQ